MKFAWFCLTSLFFSALPAFAVNWPSAQDCTPSTPPAAASCLLLRFEKSAAQSAAVATTELAAVAEGLRQIQKEAQTGDLQASAQFVEGLAQCRLASLRSCGEIQCSVPIAQVARASDKVAFCAHRRTAQTAFYSLDFSQLQLSGAQSEDKSQALMNEFEGCARSILSAESEAICTNEKYIKGDAAEIKAQASDKVMGPGKKVDALFKDITSPFYAMFHTKAEIGKQFLASGEKDVGAMEALYAKLREGYFALKQKFEAFKAAFNPPYRAYLDLNQKVEALYDRVAGTAEDLLPAATRTQLNTAQQKNNELMGRVAATQPKFVNPPAEVEKNLKDDGIRFCKVYFCQLRSWPRFETKLAEACAASAKLSKNPLCAGNISYKSENAVKTVAISDFCNAISPENAALWQPGQSTEAAHSCLKGL